MGTFDENTVPVCKPWVNRAVYATEDLALSTMTSRQTQRIRCHLLSTKLGRSRGGNNLAMIHQPPPLKTGKTYSPRTTAAIKLKARNFQMKCWERGPTVKLKPWPSLLTE